MTAVTCLGSTLAEDGDLDAEITYRTESEWENWIKVKIVIIRVLHGTCFHFRRQNSSYN